MPCSGIEKAKRALVAALKSVARIYGVRVDLTTEAPDTAVRSAYRRVYLRAHPDKGGSVERAQRLSGAKTAWEEAQRDCVPDSGGRTPKTQLLREGRPKGASLEQMLSTCWDVTGSRF